MTKKKIMIPIMSIMLATSSMTYHHLPACMQLKQCKKLILIK